MQLASAAQMRELDRRTIEEIGIPGMVLMENAGRGTVDWMERSFGPLTGKTVCIFAGPGNNGGDGLVIARTVHARGAYPFVFFLVDPEHLQGDAAHNSSILKQIRLPFQILDTSEKMLSLIDTVLTLNRMHPIHSLVDAIFGIGLERNISGHFLDVINCINVLRERHKIPVVSVDIPTGLHSDTGALLGGAVHADLTVTYGLPKPGHYHHGGATVGQLELVDIGIPSKILLNAGLKGMALDKSTVGHTLHRRLATAHKGSTGHLLILAGSEGKTGAALLCGRGALHSGAGLVTFAVPRELNPIFETVLPEAMSVALPTAGTYLSMEDCNQITALADEKQALVLGPGMGTADKTAELILHIYTTISAPLVMDADALTVLAAHPEVIPQTAGPRIFTPHPGEMARLLGESISTVQEDRLKSAQWLCSSEKEERPHMITVLKGAGTVVADAEGTWAINSTGNPGMATGGMGDVLTGIIGGLLVQGYSPWDAACLGVCLHGLAADCIARSRPCGYTASEVAQILPRVMRTCTLQSQ
ncbi:NAD(P)H-hydrate dehydratase [Desulfobulbus alkaliphilus]|uniref:NAD(P)H-hydrate dehydratase n=1 Tax=Desulfobulbus alkaliphilus TaxID=869814 RepID=UPI001965EFA4|nr:NAD(P)H-hydrate dehydratase [Desulfobulbus alkaliphilus]MBM9538230.1 NAD(P)H-hydrate dehydratase [Desulfobulbus alkaliphilus]